MQRERFGARAAQPDEAGFTLIELMMVVLIIAILIAVLIPTFIGASNRARDRATQGSLHDALLDAKTVYSDKADYTLATPATLTASEKGLKFVDALTAPTNPNAVSVDPQTANYIVMAGQSKTGTCFYVRDDQGANGGVKYAQLPGAGGCAASGAPLPADPGWKASW